MEDFPLHYVMFEKKERCGNWVHLCIVCRCSEVVVWTVMSTPLKITETQMTVFRSLLRALADKAVAHADQQPAQPVPAGRELYLIDNFRPVQPIFERNVTYYEAPADLSTSTTASSRDAVLPFNPRQRMMMPVAVAPGDNTAWVWPSSTTKTAPADHAEGQARSSSRPETTTSKGQNRNAAVTTKGGVSRVILLWTIGLVAFLYWSHSS